MKIGNRALIVALSVAFAITSFALLLCLSEMRAFRNRASGYTADAILAANLSDALAGRQIIRLQDVPGFDRLTWDRVFFIGPYTPREVVRERVGDFPGFLWSSLTEVTEGYSLIVFTNERKVVAFFDFPERLADFDTATGTEAGFSRQDAVFRVELELNGATRVIPM